jgi:hypothetical protein
MISRLPRTCHTANNVPFLNSVGKILNTFER